MKLPRTFAAMAAAALVSPLFAQTNAPVPAADEDGAAEAAARTAVYDLAGAFSNDGYKIRHGFWFAPLESKKSAVVQVNLFAGNAYWFCAAANSPATKINVTVYDAAGTPVAPQQHYEDGARAAAGVEPAASGPYYVKVTLAEGEKSDFCLIYCYK